MDSNIEIEYANAYSEVLEVLNHMSKDDYDKIPKDMIEMFHANCNKEYQFRYDLNKEFAEQDGRIHRAAVPPAGIVRYLCFCRGGSGVQRPCPWRPVPHSVYWRSDCAEPGILS